MARKKKSEMTYMERVDRELKGATWDEAEGVGIEILARVLALHVYAREEGSEYFQDLMKRICERCHAWTHEKGNPTILAFAHLGNKLKNG